MFVCPECGASQAVQGPCANDGTMLVAVGDDLLLGAQVGAYRVARLLGIGGMGRVYKGVHPTIGSRVAIKVLSRECSDRRDLVERFFAEAKAVNLIRHESIVNVLDLSVLPDGRPYIVMEYLDGAPLAAILDEARRARQPLPIGGVARLASEVLDALGAAHAKGIVHRDLKPDNIYVTPSGRPKILDFGIAKLQPELGGSATHTGSLLGTPHYMSPEQAAGKPVDLRADLYAIGVILFECLTLERPFHADAVFDLLRQHIEAAPPSPRVIRPDIPPALEQLIGMSLAKAPDHRFSSAQAMNMALQQSTMGLPAEQWLPLVPPNAGRISQQGGWSPTPPASWGTGSKKVSAVVEPPAKKSGPRSGKGALVAVAGVVLVGGGIAAIALSQSSEDIPPKPVEQHVEVAKTEALPPPPSVDAAAVVPIDAPAVVDKKEAVRKPQPVAATPDIAPAGDNDADKDNDKDNDDDIVSHKIPPPAGYNAKRVDAQKTIAYALAEAKKVIPDAVLFRIDANGVFADGHADVTGENRSLDYRFISPTRPAKKCMFRVELTSEGAWVGSLSGFDCKEKPIGPPRCSYQQVWKKAISIGAKADDIGELGYRTTPMGKRVWYVDIGAFSEMILDDC